MATVATDPGSRLAMLRTAMRGAEVPVVLFNWMAEVERQIAELRPPSPYGYLRQEPPPEDNPNATVYEDGLDTTLVLTCGCILRAAWDAPPRHPQVGDYYACENHSRRLHYDRDTGDPVYDRDQQVERVLRDEPTEPLNRIKLFLPGIGSVEGDALYFEEVPHMANGGDHIDMKVPMPLGVPWSRVGVVLVKLDDPPVTEASESAVRFEDEYPGGDT